MINVKVIKTIGVLAAIVIVLFLVGAFPLTALGPDDFKTPIYTYAGSNPYYVADVNIGMEMSKTSYGVTETKTVIGGFITLSNEPPGGVSAASNWVLYVDNYDFVWSLDGGASFGTVSWKTTNAVIGVAGLNNKILVAPGNTVTPPSAAVGTEITGMLALKMRASSSQGSLPLSAFYSATFTYKIIADTNVNNPPITTVSGTPTTGILPLTVNFVGTATDSDGSISSYKWDFGDGSTSSSYATTTHIYNAVGSYTATFTATDDDGAKTTKTLTISVNAMSQNTPPVITTFYINPGQGTMPLTITAQVTATDVGGSISSYKWDFGDGSTSSTPTASHTYSTIGSFTVTVLITDNDGATTTETGVVVVSSALPNGDTDNDGLPDTWEMQYWGNLAQTASADPDLDDLTNLQEYQGGTDPTVSDKETEEYTWVTMGYLALLGGIIAGVLIYAFAPIPPKFKAFLALAIAMGGIILAHLYNTGVM
jgi:PKD repeat protein